uniref:Uncharacterized protein n=1 Tax=Caenorhabditis tropicalis TaxID=1561998 RepID=A0A1I7UXE7_9PELO
MTAPVAEAEAINETSEIMMIGDVGSQSFFTLCFLHEKHLLPFLWGDQGEDERGPEGVELIIDIDLILDFALDSPVVSAPALERLFL